MYLQKEVFKETPQVGTHKYSFNSKYSYYLDKYQRF